MQKKNSDSLNRLSLEAYRSENKIPLIVILDNVRSALNVGSAFRTSDAFSVESLYLCGITAQPPHREILKTALGAENSVTWRYFQNTEDAIMDCKRKGADVYAIEQVEGSISLQNFCWTGKSIAVVFGNEVEGVADELLSLVDGFIEIPQYGTKHSLNIAVCQGIVIWELFKKLKFEIK